MTERRSDLLRESYFHGLHPSGLPIYVFPKNMTTTHAIFATRFGAMDAKFRLQGETAWQTVPDGVAHFLEHKLFENPDGSDSFERFSAYGADANAYTGCGRTAFVFSCSEGFSESLRELLTFVKTPYFTKQTVKKEQGIIAEEIRMYNDNPWERCFQELMEGMYRYHPIRKNICGTERSIRRITPDLLYECHRVFYRPSNMALIVCGDVDPEVVWKIADEVLPPVTDEAPIERARVVEPPAVYRAEVSRRMQVAKPLFAIGIKDAGIPADPVMRMRRDAAMSLLEEILFSRSARFYSSLFEEGLLTASYSYGYSIGEDFGFHNLSGESDDPHEVVRRLRLYLREVAQEGIDRESFVRCQRVLYADELRSFDSTEEIASNLLSNVFDDADLFAYPEILQSIRPEELESLLSELLDESRLCLSLILPLEQD